MSEKNESGAKDARNRGLKEEEERLRDPASRPPHGETETDTPEPERPAPVQKDEEADIAHLENPPQTEGPRERSNDSV
jgi:hypothetical protein